MNEYAQDARILTAGILHCQEKTTKPKSVQIAVRRKPLKIGLSSPIRKSNKMAEIKLNRPDVSILFDCIAENLTQLHRRKLYVNNKYPKRNLDNFNLKIDNEIFAVERIANIIENQTGYRRK